MINKSLRKHPEASRQLVLIRHGQSVCNKAKKFTGWSDVDLTPQGLRESTIAGQTLASYKAELDIAHTSVLQRAIKTYYELSLQLENNLWIPHYKHWRLNERNYGALEGLSKVETVKQYGDEQVRQWRRSYDSPPPSLARDDPRHPRFDRKYASVPLADIPCSESLKMTVERVKPYWKDVVVPQMEKGARVVIVSHGNCLRGLIKHLVHMDQEEIMNFEIPTACPIIFEFDDKMKPLGFNYLMEQDELKERLSDYKQQIMDLDAQIKLLIE